MALNTSLRARSMTASLTSGIAEARHLDEVAAVGDLARRARRHRLAARRRPHADHGVGIARSARPRPAARQLRHRHLDRQRADVVAGGAVLDLAGADAEQIEDAEVDVEALVALAGEHAHADRRHLLDTAGEQAVVRRRARPDVRRRHRQPAGQQPRRARAPRPVDARQAVELPHVEIGIVDGRDRAGVVEERRGLRRSVVKRHWNVTSSTASPLLSTWIS